MWITIAGQPYSYLNAAGKKFAADFGKSIGLAPTKVNPYSNYGATAMQVMLSAIAKSDGSRASVTKGLFNVNVASSPIGSFKLNGNGDTNAGKISVYQIKGGQAVFKQVISPPVSLVAKAKP